MGSEKQSKFNELREHAKRLRCSQNISCENRSSDEIETIIHELQVHQAELEIQNEQLRNSELELVAANKRFSALFHKAPVGYVLLDERAIIKEVNDKFLLMTGRMASNPVHWSFLDFLEPISREMFTARFKAISNNPEGKSIEAELFVAGGETKTVLLEASVYEEIEETTHRGELRQVFLAISDISARKMNEEALSVSKTHMAMSMEMASMGHWQFDVASRMFTFNEEFYALYATKAELEGGYVMSVEQYAKRFLYPEDAHLVAEEVVRLFAGAEGNDFRQIEHRIIRRDGALRYIVVRFTAMRNATGRIVKTIGVNQDITDQKLREEALQTSKERYQDVARAHAGIIWEVDENFIVKHLSGRVHDLLGYEPEDLIGRNPIFLVLPEDQERISSIMTRFRHEHESIRDIECCCRHKDGRRVSFLTSGVSLFSQNGDFLGARGTHADITEMYWARRRKEIFLELHAMSNDSDEAITAMLCKVCAEFTDSPMAFFGLMEPDGAAMIAHVWSPKAMEECRISDKPLRFPIESAGLWAEPIRRKETLIVNDYKGVQNKRGLPVGHVPVTRYLGVPIVIGDQVVAVAGAANRVSDYESRHTNRLRVVLSLVSDFLSARLKEEALRESTRRYQELFENSRDGFVVVDMQGRFIDANKAYCEMLGYSIDELKDKDVFYAITPECWHKWEYEEIWRKRLIYAGTSGVYDKEYIRKDGTVFPVELQSFAVKDDNGDIKYSWGIARDITERKRAEEALKANDRLIQAVLDNLPIGVAVNSIAPGVVFDYMNDNFPRLYRTTREALANPDVFWEAVYEDTEFRESIKRRILDDCASGQPDRMAWMDVPLAREGHETTFINARNIPIPDKQLMISTVWDVTEYKRLEERLRRSEALYRDLFEQSIDAVAIQEGLPPRFVWVNPAFCELFGYTTDEIYTFEPKEIWKLVHQEDQEIVRQSLTFRLSGKLDAMKYSFRIVRKEVVPKIRTGV